MKIIFDGIIFSLQKNGGISRYFIELINGLAKRKDCEVIVILRKDVSPDIFDSGVKIEFINSLIFRKYKIFKYLSVFFDNINLNLFSRKRKDFKGAIFHSTYYRNPNINFVKKIITVHDFTHEYYPGFFNAFTNIFYKKNKRRAILKSDGLICISNKTKEDMINLYDIKANNVKVIYHGVSDNFHIIDELEKNKFLNKKNIIKPYILYIGSRVLYKNFKAFIMAFYSWNKNTDFDILCIGSQFNKKELSFLDKLSLKNRVFAVENVSDFELVNYYNCAKFFVYPSEYEGFGLPLLESFSCGTPVVCSGIEVFKEIGLNFPLFFSNEDEMVNCFENAIKLNIINNEEMKNHLKNFSWETTVNKTFDFYKKILNI